jgi:hypothetical protein
MPVKSVSILHRFLLVAMTLLTVAGLLGCQPLARPTASVVPTLDLVGTVTAQAAPMIATQTAISAASTQVAQAQATLTAQAQAQMSVASQTAAVTSAGATQTALAQAAAAQAATGTALAQLAAAQAATATALAVPSSTPRPPATTVIPASATPSSTPVPCVTLDTTFAPIADRVIAAGLDTGCPTKSTTRTANGGLQEYWSNASNPDPATHARGLMVWDGDQSRILAIRGSSAQVGSATVAIFPDTWQEGEAEVAPACASLAPPAGYMLPIRGFGKVWCANKLGDTLGWPNRKETAATLYMQPTARGMLLKISAPDQATGYLVALDLVAMRAVAMPVAP